MALKITKKEAVPAKAPVKVASDPLSHVLPGGSMVGASGIVGKAAVGTSEVIFPDGSSKIHEGKVKDVVMSEAPAYVSVSMGLTRNLGNFESVKIHVGISMPCPPTPEEIENAYHEAKGWVDTHIEQVSSEIDQELGK